MGRDKNNISIKFRSMNGSQRVTNSNHYLEIKVKNKTTNIMLDFGGLQEGCLTTLQSFDANKVNLDLSNIDFAIASHGHFDHIMNFCQLLRLGYQGNVYMTDLTLQLTEHITEDGIKIHEKPVEYLNKQKKIKRKIEPYMNERSRQYFLDSVKAYGFYKWVTLTDEIRFKFIPSGHISGASMIYIEVSNEYNTETILFTGDTSCDRDIPFTMKPNIKNLPITHLITEATYGGQKIKQKTEEEVIDDLHNIIIKTCIDKKGDVLIPSFALSRSTNIAYYLKKLYENHQELNNIRIYMVSPLMKKCHNTIGLNEEFYDDFWKNEMDLFSWNRISFITEYNDILGLGNNKEPCIIISSSGMGDNGVNTFLLPEKIRHKNNSIVFVGYCAEGTIGRKILDREQKQVQWNIDGQKGKVNIKANIENLTGLSSHACSYEIINMIKTANINKLKNIIIVHGDKERCDLFKEELNKFLKCNIYTPRIGQEIKF